MLSVEGGTNSHWGCMSSEEGAWVVVTYERVRQGLHVGYVHRNSDGHGSERGTRNPYLEGLKPNL